MIKDYYNLIGQEYIDLYLVKYNFPKNEVYTGKQRIVTCFILGYFLQKVMTKNYKNSGKLQFGPILDPFSFLGKNNF